MPAALKKQVSTGYLAAAGILTREQMLKELNITNDTLERWETEDKFPSRAVGRTKFYDIDAIKRWINGK